MGDSSDQKKYYLRMERHKSAMKDENAVWSMENAIADHLLAYKPLRIPEWQ